MCSSEELLEREAEKPELLVPITIDLEVPSDTPDAPGMQGQGIKIKDRFLWNVNEPFISPNLFAQILCDDLDISPRTYAPIIAELISNQVEEAQGIAEIDVVDEDVTEEDVVWSDEEVEDVMEVDENGDEYIVEKVWAESDCRVTLNVGPSTFVLRWKLTAARHPDIHPSPARPYRMGPLVHPLPQRLRQILRGRPRPHRRSHPAHRARPHRRDP